MVTITSRPEANLVSDPTKTSRWIAVNGDYPVEFTLTRKDRDFVTIVRNNNNTLTVYLIGNFTSEISSGDKFYLHSASYPDEVDGTYTANTVTYSGTTTIIVTVETVNVSWSNDPVNQESYVNILSSRNDHRVHIKIINSETGLTIGEADYTGFNSGEIALDVSQWVKLPISIPTDFSNVADPNKDTTVRFYIEFTEKYGAFEETTTDLYNYNAVSGAMQLQQYDAPNMLRYTAFNADLPEDEKALFLTEARVVRYYQGWPMKVGFVCETEGAYPNFQRIEDSFNEDTSSAGSTSTSFIDPDMNFMNLVTVAGNYPETTKYLDFYIDSSLTPLNSCGALSADDWKYQTWELDGSSNLVGIKVDSNSPAGDIASINSRPTGTLYRDNVSIDTLTWNATTERYEPSLSDIMLSGVMRFDVNSISVTTTAGEACSHNFSQEIEVQSFAPYATDVTLSNTGLLITGTLISGTYTYNDLDNDPEGASTYMIRRYSSFSDANNDTDGTAGTLVSSSQTYTVQSGDGDNYFRFWVTPVASNPPETGTIVGSNTLGPVLTEAFSYSTDLQTGHILGLQATSGTELSIDWGDGNTENQTADGLFQSYPHNYTSAGTYNVVVYGDGAAISTINMQSMGVLSIDISECRNIQVFNLFSNSGLASITNPTSYTGPGVALYYANGASLSGTLDFGDMVWLNIDCRIHANASLTDFDISGVTGTFNIFYFYSCNITGSKSLPVGLNSNSSHSANVLRGYSNPNLTGFTLTGINRLSILEFHSCNISGSIDFDTIQFDNAIINYSFNTSVNGWDDTSSTGTYQHFIFNNCSLSGSFAVRLPFGSGDNNIFRIDNNSSSSFTLSVFNAGGPTSKMRTFYVNDSGVIGSLSLPEWEWTSSVSELSAKNTSISSLSFNASTSGTIKSVDLNNCSNITGTVDFSTFAFIDGTLDMDGCDASSVTGINGDIEEILIDNGSMSGTLVFGSTTFDDAIIRVGNHASLININFSSCSGTISELNIGNNGFDSTIDLTGTGSLNFSSSGAIISATAMSSFDGFIHPAGQTGGISEYSVSNTAAIVQTNGLGALTIEADAIFNFVNITGATSTIVDNWFNEIEGHTAGSGASGTIDGSSNPAPTATSLTARNNMTTAGYTVTHA